MAYDTPAEESIESPLALPAEEKPARGRRRRRVLVPEGEEREELVAECLRRVSSAQDERADWIQKRLARYAKLRGWLEPRDFPWADASNQHVPIMLANKLRTDAGLFNAVLGLRPVMSSTPTRLEHRQVAESIDHLIDHQMFVEQDGDRRIEKFIDQFTGDGTVFSFQPWVKESGCIYDVRIIKRPLNDGTRVIEAADIDALVVDQVGAEGFAELRANDADGYDWTGVYKDTDDIEREVPILVFDHHDEGKIEVQFEWDATTFEGPAMIVLDLEDVVAPMRSENLQPVSAHNPTGAPWVAVLSRTNLDAVRRRKKDGTYDLLTDEDLEAIEGVVKGRADEATEHAEDQLKTQRDEQTGLANQMGDDEREWVDLVTVYGRYDANMDGLDEDVILTIIKDVPVLARARYLTEMYPGLPPHRPFAEARFIPVADQLYGMGQIELMEGLHDMLHVLVNQNLDNGTLANLPFFGYRPSSGFKPDEQRLEPGIGIPLDNPQTDLVFPAMPHRDQTWSFNMINLGMGFLEKLVQISPMQFGQVPQGKASALRTTGTTMAILQQGAAMPEQILRRLFIGLRDVWAQFHMMNTRFLPPNKRFLVTGKPLDSEEKYGVIDDRKRIDIPVAFDFQATLLNTNKGAVQQALMQLGQMLFSPIAIQFGLVDGEKFYNWALDTIKSSQLDPSRYIKRPMGVPDQPRITSEEAILEIMEGRLPTGAPLEPAQEHLQKLMEFTQQDELGYLSKTPGSELLLREYLMRVQQLVQQEMQQQQLMQAAAQFSQMMGGGQGGGGGRPPEAGQPPAPQAEAGTAEELAGATGGAA